MSQYSDAVKRLPSNEAAVGRMPCTWCGELTIVSTLNQHGARCTRCYNSYCREGSKGGVDGFVQNAPDTPTQAEMRKRLKGHAPARNVLSEDAW